MSTRTSRLAILCRAINRTDDSVFNRLIKRSHTGGEKFITAQSQSSKAKNDSARPDWYQATHRSDS